MESKSNSNKKVITGIIIGSVVLLLILVLVLVIGLKGNGFGSKKSSIDYSDKLKKEMPLEDIFTDSAFADAVAEELEIDVEDDVSQSDLNNVEFLYVYDPIEKLDGIQYLRKLNYATFGEIEDASGFIGNTSIENLSLLVNKDFDYKDLEGMEGLLSVDLNAKSKSVVYDIKSLSSLAEATDISLNKGKVDFKDAIENDIVETLNLRSVSITNEDEITNFSGVENLYIESVKVDSYDFISEISNLDTLNITGNDAKLPKKYDGANLSVDVSGDTDLKAMCAFENLTTLYITGDGVVSDFSALTCLSELESLNISDTGITDITFLSELTGLSSLGITLSEVTDITVVGTLTNLYDLSLSDNNIVDIKPLANLKDLEYLSIAGNKITDYTPLDGLSSLDYDPDDDYSFEE